jgi:glycosyltransferase involved in cell wall biosynthesis
MSGRLTILTAMPFFAWRFGGSVEQARIVSRALAQRGHDVRIATTDLGCDGTVALHTWGEEDGYRVFRAHASGWSRRPPYPAPRALVREIERALASVDLVTTHVGLTLLNRTVLRCARRAAVPFVYNAQGALSTARLRQKRLRKAIFLRCVEHPLLRRVDAVQALTLADSSDHRGHGVPSERIHVIPNGVDVAAWSRVDGAGLRRAWGVADSDLVVLFLGRLAPEKGLDLLLRAAAPIVRARDDVWIVIAGPDDGQSAQVARWARDLRIAHRIVCPGAVPTRARAELFGAADVFAHTSYSEGLPVVVLEAAACSLPLWLTTTCNLPEVATAGAGCVAAPDVAALEECLRELLQDPGRRREAGRRARALVVEQFALDSVVDRLEALYREMVDARTRAGPRGP